MGYPTLDAALQYASLGYRVHPLRPGTKIPDLRHWPEEASSDPATVERQFAVAERRAARPHLIAHSRPNVGIVTGSGLAVVDVDVKHGGEVPQWCAGTLTARTPSGGYHFYFAVDGVVPNSVGRLAPGVDVRGERGQVAAAPSVTDDGVYRWVDDSQPIAHIDTAALTPVDVLQDFTGRSVAGFQWRDEVPVGQRNNYLTSLAGHLFASDEDAPAVLEILTQHATELGFTPRDGELRQIVRSVKRYH